MKTTPLRPRADRRQLQQIIAGLSEGVILIDPDGSISWANETALRIHEVDQLAGLGGDAAGYRKRFILRYRNNWRLRRKQYPIERVLAGEAFDDVVVQVARFDQEEFRRVHQVRSLILSRAGNGPESLVLIMQDVTDRYEAEERFERAFSTNPAPALICRLADLRYIKVNHGFLDMSGYAREDLLGRSAYEIDVFEGAKDREQAIENLHAGKTIGQMEATLPLPGGGGKFVVVAGQPIKVGEEECMLFTFIDLDPRKRIEDELRHVQERFSKAFRLAPVPMTVCTLDGLRVLETNDAFSACTGYSADEVAGCSLPELLLRADAGACRTFEEALLKAQSVRNFEMQIRTREEALVDCLASAETVTIQGEPCVLGVLQDITERKRSEGELTAAIEAVMKDTSWFTQTFMDKLAQSRSPGGIGNGSALAELTPRERDVLGLLCAGRSDAEIAHELDLSRNTVRNHLSTLYSKIGVNRRSAAIVWGRERGVIDYTKPARVSRPATRARKSG